MNVTTNSKRVLATRRRLLELLLSDHPFNCLICAKSTDCELQNAGLGVRHQHAALPRRADELSH
jgi:NADP-reducing hydrogenase subunit HndD